MPVRRGSECKLHARFSLLVAAALLTACTGAAYVDSRREAGQRLTVGRSNADVVAICHSGGEPPPPEVVKMAEDQCTESGRVPRYEGRTRFSCDILTSSRAYFRCVKPVPNANAGG